MLSARGSRGACRGCPALARCRTFWRRPNSLYREAARNTLRHVEEDDPALSYLLLHLDNDFAAAERLIMNMLEKREQWLRHTGANPDFDAVRMALEDSLEQLILVELRRLREGFDPDVAAEIALLREMEQFPEARIEDIDQWKSVADLLLTSGNEWRKAVNKNLGFPPGHPRKARMEQLLARLRGEDELLESLQRFRELPGPRFSDSQWQAMQAAVSVVTLAVAELQLVFRERGRVDFAELAIRASEALGHIDSPTDLALVLGQNIQHILVDEFQDTSYTQFELVEKLTAGWEPGDGHTLFLVGDPMQSIYRFRQADVGLFLKARLEGIGSIQLEPLTLSVNFRSRQGIVDWVNETFAGILPAADDPASGAVAFSRSTVREESAKYSEECVQVHGFLDSVDEAKRVVELVKASGDGKVAVLVRARSHLVEIVGVLKRERIPFQAIEIDELGARQVIEDLMALTLGLLHAADRVSWLAILRAPWCGLELSDLHTLAGGDHRTAIWDLLHREDISLSPEGGARIRNILPVLDEADRRARTASAAGLGGRRVVPAGWSGVRGKRSRARRRRRVFRFAGGRGRWRRSRGFRMVPRAGESALRTARRTRRRWIATDDHPQSERPGIRYCDFARARRDSSIGRAAAAFMAGTEWRIIVGADFRSRPGSGSDLHLPFARGGAQNPARNGAAALCREHAGA